jgi:molybdate-binding protein
LELSAEEVFGSVAPVRTVRARPIAPVDESGSRVALAPVGDTFVALPLADVANRAGFTAATGLTVDAESSVRQGQRRRSPDTQRSRPMRSVLPIGTGRPMLVIAGDDPALPLLEVPLGLLDPPLGLAWWPRGGSEAVGLASRGLVHAVAVCQRGQSGERLSRSAARLLQQGAAVIAFCSWREGLVLRPELAPDVTGVADLQRAGLRVVNREPGTDARQLLDKELADKGIDPRKLSGYETHTTGHLQVGAAIAAGLADAGVASEPTALAYGLAFVPLASRHVDLVVSPAATGSLEAQALLMALSSRWLLEQLASLPGYDPSHCGERVVAGWLQGECRIRPCPV